MNSLPPPADSGQVSGIVPPAICPTCGAPGSGHHLQPVPADVPRVEYLCATGQHMWITTWFGGAA